MPLSRREWLTTSMLATAALAVRPWPARATPSATPVNGITAALDAVAAASLKAGACPGMALRLYRHGQVVVERDYGMANLETRTPVDAASVFRIGSLTKQFTAAMILKLTTQGRLRLDDPVARYLPAFQHAKPFTLRELLDHTAGLHDDEQQVSCPAGPAGPRTQLQLAAEIARQQPLFDFEPGSAWLYSNTNYIVAGAVVEQVTGLPLAQAATQLIFAPLGLQATAFDTSGAVVAGRVDGYSPAERPPGSFTHASYLEISEAGGAGAMRSTAADLAAWHRALFSQRLFPADVVRTMLTPGRLRDGRPSSRQRFSPADANYGETQYALGFLIPPAIDGHRSVMHYGFINGFAACLESFLDIGLTTVMLCNGDMGPQMPFHDMRRIIASRVVPQLPSAANPF